MGSQQPRNGGDAPSTQSHGAGSTASIQSVVSLYYDRYKPLYNRLQVFNELPVEMLFELAAAWDHVSRFWRFKEREDRCADMAARHLKRAVFDAYKLLAKKVADDFDELRRIDTSLIDNGEFDRNVRILVSEIRQAVIDARAAEGETSAQNDWSRAFEAWVAVDEKMQRFWMDYYFSPRVEWARRKTTEFNWKRRLEGLAIGVLGSLIAAAVWWYLAR